MIGKDRLRVGVIGVGKMGEQHAFNLYRFAAKAELAGLQDLDRARCERLALALGSPRVFDSPADLIDSPEIEAVLIAAPDSLHAELATRCLALGKSVFCEKPLASKPADALSLLRAEAEGGRRLLSLGFHRRFDPYHLAIKEAADSGRLGRPLLWKGVHRNARPPYDSSGPFILVNTAGHDFDSARWLLGAEFGEVAVSGLRSREDLPADSRDLLLVRMTMEDGRLGLAEIYVGAGYGYEVQAELVCQGGVATTDQPSRLTLRQASTRASPVAADWTAPFQDAYLAEILAWVDSALEKARGGEGHPFPGASAWDGYAALMCSAAASLSLIENRPVAVELVEKPSLYVSGGKG